MGKVARSIVHNTQPQSQCLLKCSKMYEMFYIVYSESP